MEQMRFNVWQLFPTYEPLAQAYFGAKNEADKVTVFLGAVDP